MKNEIRETKLPGVGVELDFSTEEGVRVGVISHHSGRRDFLVFSAEDPDMAAISIGLTEDEARMVGQMLGASEVVQSMQSVQQSVGGLTIDWITIQPGWPVLNLNLRNLALENTETQLVAVIRDETALPTPEPTFRLRAGDVAVVIGRPEGIRAAQILMAGRG